MTNVRIKTLVDGWVEVVRQAVFDDHEADPDIHHNKSHAHDGADGSGTVAHSDTTGQTINDHHNKSHAHNGVDGSGVVEGVSLISTGVAAKKVPTANGSDGVTWEYQTDSVITQTGATLALDETHYVVLCDASSNAITTTLPAAADYPEKEYTIKKVDTSMNTVTLDGDGSETVDGALTQIIVFQYDAIKVKSDGVNWHII